MCVYTCIPICRHNTYNCRRAQAHIYIHTYRYREIRIHTYIYVYVHVYKRIHIYMYTCICIHIYVRFCRSITTTLPVTVYKLVGPPARRDPKPASEANVGLPFNADSGPILLGRSPVTRSLRTERHTHLGNSARLAAIHASPRTLIDWAG